MKIYENPERSNWDQIFARPASTADGVEPAVKAIVERVRDRGDEALRTLTREFDGLEVENIEVTAEELSAVSVSPELEDAIDVASANIEKFHRASVEGDVSTETMPGVLCWRRSVPIERVGLYVPGGTAPLLSTVLMLAIPAKIAGCKELIMCTPASASGAISPEILYAAKRCRVDRIFKVGGAQAVAAMAFGTESVPNVDKIFGPGNQYVTAAKQMLADKEVAIDMPAGPSEVLVYADDSSDPEFVAADLLSQAEHGTDSQVVLLTPTADLARRAIDALKRQIKELPRKSIAEKSIAASAAVVVNEEDKAIQMINFYAPEHLILAVRNAKSVAEKIVNAGSVFIGNYSCESAGDYASGPNHTLPTSGYARNYSGVSVDSFVKKITFQEISAEGLLNIGPTVEVLAAAESLDAHKNAVSIRLESIRREEGGVPNANQ